jgi:Tfp pilus assembly protein PilN
MRPVNLIPPEQRRGRRASMRTGALPYVLMGALVALLVGVALLVTSNNQIAERKSEVTQLKREDAAAKAQAARLASYVQFQALHEQRLATIASLADSRFDWERVMRELALILPDDVWLSNLNASASSGGAAIGGSEGALRAGVAGPALVISGCATGQEAVAGFVTALKDIDGVTRVGVESSSLPEQENGSVSSGGEEGGGECQTRDFIAEFTMTVAFDAAPVPAVEAEGESPEAVPEAAEEATAEPESETTGTESEAETEPTAGG